MADFFLWQEDQAGGGVLRLSLGQDLTDELTGVFRTSGEALLIAQELIPLSDEPFTPDETEAWNIEGFKMPEDLARAFENPIGTPSAGRNIEESRVKCIIGHGLGDAGDVTAFQVIDKRQVLSTRGFSLILDGDVFRKLRDPGLLVSDQVQAVFVNGNLIFKSLWWARRIFNLESYYVEATQDQIDAFVARPDVAVRDPEFAEESSQWERKRIGYLMRSGLLDQTRPTEVREKAAEYGIDVEVDLENGQERLVVPEEASERRKLLKFLEEDYYHGPLTDTRYVANSKRRVGNG